jgi:hypothetical protein
MLDRITVDWLLAPSAIHPIKGEDLATFRDEFGEVAELTRANLHRAAARGLPLGWPAKRILPPTEFTRFVDAIRERTREARQAYEATADHEARQRACAEATDALNAAIAPHLAEHYPRIEAASTAEEKADALAALQASTGRHFDACRAVTGRADPVWVRQEQAIIADALADALRLP